MLKKLLLLCATALTLAVNEGPFAADRGLAALKDGGRNPHDRPLESLRVMPTVSEKEGYAEPHERLRATDVRGDYDSDAVFANFREVRGGRLRRGSLYRSSIPSSTERPRAPYADQLAREAGIRTVLNLANSPERLKKNISGWSEDLFGSLNTEPTVFTGYETLNDTGVVVALSDEETLTDAIATDEQAKEDVLVVLDKTPFYAEMGGQVADQGVLTSADCSLRVLDVKKTPKGYYVHTCVLESGIVKVGDHLTAKVDKEYRMAVCRNHTATHLLQAALREVLGDHVHQAGSYQDGEITHFDFTHFSAVTAEELARVEKIVNDRIFDAMDVTVKEMPIDEAKKLGAMALFGEKYGKVVRVVDIEGWSTEFCGGTHVRNTAQIGCFKIVSESSVAAGIRRIEAVTGKNLLLRANKQETMLHTVAAALKANNVAGLPARAEAVMAENKAMSKELDDMKAKIAASKVTSLFDDAEEVGGVKIASAYFTGTSGDTLRGMCDTVRDKAVNPVVAVLVGKAEDKITMAVTVNKMAQEKGLKAGVLVKEISAIAGGKGGGKPDFAMAGLKDENKIDEALAAVKGIVEKQLG